MCVTSGRAYCPCKLSQDQWCLLLDMDSLCLLSIEAKINIIHAKHCRPKVTQTACTAAEVAFEMYPVLHFPNEAVCTFCTLPFPEQLGCSFSVCACVRLRKTQGEKGKSPMRLMCVQDIHWWPHLVPEQEKSPIRVEPRNESTNTSICTVWHVCACASRIWDAWNVETVHPKVTGSIWVLIKLVGQLQKEGTGADVIRPCITYSTNLLTSSEGVKGQCNAPFSS